LEAVNLTEFKCIIPGPVSIESKWLSILRHIFCKEWPFSVSCIHSVPVAGFLSDSILPHLIWKKITEKLCFYVIEIALGHNAIRLQVCGCSCPGREGELLACQSYIDVNRSWQWWVCYTCKSRVNYQSESLGNLTMPWIGIRLSIPRHVEWFRGTWTVRYDF
jgi:hypothetical protein